MIVKFLNKFLNSKSKTIPFTAFLLSIAALVSRVLGLLRDNLLANLLPKDQTDIYYAAFRIPDFVYGILITGGIVAAFLPVFAAHFKKSKKEAEVLTNNVLTFFLLSLVFISFFLAIFTPFLVDFIVPGFSKDQKALTVALTRIMFLSPILLGMSAIFSGILQYFNLFFAYALAPIFYNLGIIFGILVFRSFWGLAGLAWGVILGAGLHLILQVLPVLKSGFRVRFSFDFWHPGLKKIFKLMIPRTLASVAYHINLIVITAIASTLAAGSIRVFNFANNLQWVPIGLVGIPFATAAFPFFSRYFVNNQKEEFSKSLSSTFSQILFLIIPLSVLTFLLRNQIVQIIFGTSVVKKGFFDWWDIQLTPASLGIFSISLFAAALIPFLARAFFALQDTTTPVKIAVWAMILNVFLCYFFVWLLKFPNFFQKTIINFLHLRDTNGIAVLGLPLALSIATIFQFSLLSFSLKKKTQFLKFKQIFKSFLKILISAFIMALLTYFALQILDKFLNTEKALGIFLQGFLAGIFGVCSYLALSFLLKLKEPKIIYCSFLAQFKKTNIRSL